MTGFFSRSSPTSYVVGGDQTWWTGPGHQHHGDTYEGPLVRVVDPRSRLLEDHRVAVRRCRRDGRPFFTLDQGPSALPYDSTALTCGHLPIV
jgi:hypothetical protein